MTPREPQPAICPHCDFGTGMRGMDRCSKCDGIGSGFWVPGPRFYPNTKAGYDAAFKALNANQESGHE